MQEKALRYRDVVKHFVCHLLQTQRGRSRRCSGICSWLCFSCLKACVSWSKSCLVRNPSDHPQPALPLHTSQMSMSEPVLWLKYQVKNGTRFTCVLVCNRAINCLRNWQRLAIVSTLEVIAWQLHETLHDDLNTKQSAYVHVIWLPTQKNWWHE